ncbi:hypothetical protein ACWGKX_34800, partial [Streptomyces tricolor]
RARPPPACWRNPPPRPPTPPSRRVFPPRAPRPDGDERSFLTSVAVRGIRAIGEPELRAAFTHRDQPWRE